MALTLSPISLAYPYRSSTAYPPYTLHLTMSHPPSPDDSKISLPGISSLIEAVNGAPDHGKL
jgi:hypothetical protein